MRFCNRHSERELDGTNIMYNAFCTNLGVRSNATKVSNDVWMFQLIQQAHLSLEVSNLLIAEMQIITH